MAVAIALIVGGITLIYSALKGLSLPDVLAGKAGSPLDPAGGRADIEMPSPGSGATPASGNDPKGKFKGPNAGTLRFLADAAVNQFDLKITEICRSPNAPYGAANSLHKQCRAFDAVGSVPDKVAFARYAAGFIGRGVSEVFCDQAGMIAPGYPHDDHVHVGG